MQDLYDALYRAQAEFPVISKDSEVQVKNKDGRFLYAYKYADLTSIISATRPALTKYGLSFSQGFDQPGWFMTTIRHKSGQQIAAGVLPADLSRNIDGKELAARVTYLKRVSLTAALGVSADEDLDAAADDAQKDRQTIKEPSAPITARYAPPTTQEPDVIEKPLIDQIGDLARVKGVSNAQLKEFIAKMGKKKSAECTEGELMTIFNWLRMK